MFPIVAKNECYFRLFLNKITVGKPLVNHCVGNVTIYLKSANGHEFLFIKIFDGVSK